MMALQSGHTFFAQPEKGQRPPGFSLKISDKQTFKQTNCQTNTRSNKQTFKQTNFQTDKLPNKQTFKPTNFQTNKLSKQLNFQTKL